jgi:hypothetical protein
MGYSDTFITSNLGFGLVALCTKLLTSAHAGPMLRVNCPVFSPFAQPPLAPFFSPSRPHM